MFFAQVTKLGDSLGRSLASDNISVVPRCFPDMGEREQFPGQGIFVDQCPIFVFVCLIEVAFAQGLERFLHRIEWVGFTGEHGEAHQLVKSSGQRDRRHCRYRKIHRARKAGAHLI